MASCSLTDLLSDACSNKFNCVDSKMGQAIELELWSEIAGNTSTLGELYQEACENGFMQLSMDNPNQANSVMLQLLCDISSG